MGLPAPIGNWITVVEAARRLGMSTSGVHCLCRRKQLKSYRFGNVAAFLDADVDRVVNRPPTTGRPRNGFSCPPSKTSA
jgi:hypothetical protein